MATFAFASGMLMPFRMVIFTIVFFGFLNFLGVFFPQQARGRVLIANLNRVTNSTKRRTGRWWRWMRKRVGEEESTYKYITETMKLPWLFSSSGIFGTKFGERDAAKKKSMKKNVFFIEWGQGKAFKERKFWSEKFTKRNAVQGKSWGHSMTVRFWKLKFLRSRRETNNQ